MGQVDRIPPVSPALLQTQTSDGIQMRKEGREQSGDKPPKHDQLELHDSEEPAEEVAVSEKVVELFPEHGLDLTA